MLSQRTVESYWPVVMVLSGFELHERTVLGTTCTDVLTMTLGDERDSPPSPATWPGTLPLTQRA